MGLPRNALIRMPLYVSLAFTVMAGCADSSLKASRHAMGTVVEISIGESPLAHAEQRAALEKAFAEIERLEDLMSTFDAASEVSRINRLGANERLRVSAETFDVVERSLYLSRLTEGAFDITVQPLMEAWGFYNHLQGETSPDTLFPEGRARVLGFENIILDRTRNEIGFTKEDIRIDLGGIAQGYATDRASKVLRSLGVENALVNVGGEIYCLGGHRDRDTWVIGIQHPRDPKRVVARLKLVDQAVSTSGDYEKYIIRDGRRYSHIMDPRKGSPAETDVISVTVLAKECWLADGLATALFVLGSERGMELVESLHGGVEALFMTEAGTPGAINVTMSAGLKGKVDFVEDRDVKVLD